MTDLDDDLTAALARSGVQGLSEADLLYLRVAWTRLQRPLSLPVGFVRTTAPLGVLGCLSAQDIDD